MRGNAFFLPTEKPSISEKAGQLRDGHIYDLIIIGGARWLNGRRICGEEEIGHSLNL